MEVTDVSLLHASCALANLCRVKVNAPTQRTRMWVEWRLEAVQLFSLFPKGESVHFTACAVSSLWMIFRLFTGDKERRGDLGGERWWTFWKADTQVRKIWFPLPVLLLLRQHFSFGIIFFHCLLEVFLLFALLLPVYFCFFFWKMHLMQDELHCYHFFPSQLYLELDEATGRLKQEYLRDIMEK